MYESDCNKKHKQMAGRMKNVMATYNEAEDLINIGAYKAALTVILIMLYIRLMQLISSLCSRRMKKFDFEDEVTQLSDIFADYEAFENGSLQLKK